MNQGSTVEDGWRGFIQLCLLSANKERLDELFGLFLTLEEKEVLALRFLLIKDLLEGRLSQREISQKRKISISKITRGSNALKIIKPSLKEFLHHHM